MKPGVKSEGQSNNQHSAGDTVNCRDNYIEKEKFVGADPDLFWHVFEAKRNQSE